MTNNPRISLDLKGVSALEAVAALSEAADIPVRLPLDSKLAKIRGVGGTPPNLLERAEFCWVEHTFAQAVRDLCERYQLLASQYVDGHYELFPWGERFSFAEAEPLVDFNQGGVRVYAESLNRSQERCARYMHTPAGSRAFSHSLSDLSGLFVRIGCQVAGWDADRLALVRNWAAEDDTGQRLEQRSGFEEKESWDDLHWRVARFGNLPDEWGTGTTLASPAPEATRLRELTGDLLAFQRFDYRTLEFRLPLDGAAQRSVDGVHVEIKRFDIEAPEEPDNPDPELRGPVLCARLRKPEGVAVSSPGQIAFVRPLLIGASGRKYAYRSRYLDELWEPRSEMAKITTRFAASDDPPAKIVFELLIKSQPEKLLTFCLRDVPLP